MGEIKDAGVGVRQAMAQAGDGKSREWVGQSIEGLCFLSQGMPRMRGVVTKSGDVKGDGLGVLRF